MKLIKNLPTNKKTSTRGFTGEFYPVQILPKNCRWNTPKLILQRPHHHLVPKPDKEITKKENFRPISLMNIDLKIPKNILAKRI